MNRKEKRPGQAPVISLTTDFGTNDWFVGTLKGVISGITPEVKVVDLTHEIPAGDIRAGAFALACSCQYFPRQTIHLAVVDPGVGSARPAIAVQTARYVFVGPDNGVLSWALANEEVREIRRLENTELFLPSVSRTFHGRDIFAPVCAHLAKAIKFSRIGSVQADYVRIPWPEPVERQASVLGELLYIDHFGNAITNIPNGIVEQSGKELTVSIGANIKVPVAPFYQAVPPGRPVAVPGSTGFLEIALNGGNAARELKLGIGSGLTLWRPKRSAA